MAVPTHTAGARDLRLLRSFASRIDPTDPGAHNNLGVLYYNAGLYEEAVAAFMRAVELDPRMEVARRNFEVACLNCGRADQRVSELREHLRLHPRDREARWELGRMCALLGEHQEAIAQFTELLAVDPGDPGALIQLGLSYKAADAIDDSYACFGRALEADPNSSLVYFYLAEIEYSRGLNDRAIELLGEAIARNDTNWEAWYLLGFALGDAGRHDEARDAANRAVELHPELARAHANLALVDDPTARYVDKAIRDAERGAQVDASADSQLAHITLGLAFRSRGYYAEALAEYERALKRGEDLDLVRQAMAELHLLRHDAPRALEQYDALIASHPEYPKLWNERGVALHQNGRYVEALDSYARALAIDPFYRFALNNCGTARYHAGDREGALACFTRALDCDPGFTKARLNQALLLYKGRRLQQAIEEYRAVLSAGDDANPVAWNGIGLVLADLGRHEEARTAFARAIQARPRYAEAHYNLSFALSSLGDFDGALRENNLAIAIEPFYVQQRFELALDLEFDDPALAIDSELGADQRTETAIEEFAFDSGVLDSLFSELSPSPSPSATASAGADRMDTDPYAMAADFLSKGFVDRAHAEVVRAMRRGADAPRGGTLLGDVFARQRLWGEALERYRAVRREAPDYLPAIAGEATALLRLGKAAESRELAEVVAARTTGDVEVLVLLAAARDAAGDPQGALAALHDARATAPSRADVPKQIGDIARRLADTSGAVAAYRDAVALDARYVDARLSLARLHADAGDWDAAQRELTAALDLEPGNTQAALELSLMHRKSGRPRDAMLLLIALLERDLYHFDALMALGETLLELQLPADAMVAFSRVLRFDPGHLGARRAIKTITEWQPGLAATGTRGRARRGTRWQ